MEKNNDLFLFFFLHTQEGKGLYLNKFIHKQISKWTVGILKELKH